MDDSENRGRMRTSSTDQIAMFLALLTMSMGVAIVGPVLDDIRRDFDVSFTELGLIFALPTLARVFFTLPSGYLADRFSARSLTFLGALSAALSGVGMGLAPSFELLLASSMIAGAGSALASTAVLGHALRSGNGASRSKGVGRLMSSYMVGGVAGPVLSGALADSAGWRSAFIVVAVVNLVSAGIAWAFISARRPRGRVHRLGHWYKPSSLGLSKPVLDVVSVSALLWGAAMGFHMIVLPLYGSVGVRLDAASVGLVLAVSTGVRALSIFFSGEIIERVGRVPAFAVCAGAGLVGSILLLLSPSLGAFLLVAAAFSAVLIVGPFTTVLVAERVPAGELGRSMAGMQFLTDTFMLGVPLGLGYLLDASGLFGLVGLVFLATYAVIAINGLRVFRNVPGNASGEAVEP